MMRAASISLITFVAVLGLKAQFDLELTPQSTQVLQYTELTADYVLTNNGAVRNIPIGIDRYDKYIFAFYQTGEEEEIAWRDESLPVPRFQISQREFFDTGDSRNSSFTIFWHPENPIFEELGTYSIRAMWLGPDGEVFSDPVDVTVVAPTGNDALALDALIAADVLEALGPIFWLEKTFLDQAAFDADAQVQAADNVRNTYPSTVYGQRLLEVRQIYFPLP